MILCTASQQSCACGSHCRPKTNQYAIHRNPQPCCPTRQLRPSCLETACHAVPSCQFIVWLKLLSLAMVRHCICSMYHVLTCSLMSVLFISISCHILRLLASKYAHTATCNGAVSPSQKFNLYTMANKCQWQPHFFTVHCGTMRRHLHQTCVHTKEYLSQYHIAGPVQPKSIRR